MRYDSVSVRERGGVSFLGGVVVLFGGSGERERDFGELGAAS